MMSQWRTLRNRIDQLNEELGRTHHPLPSQEMCELLIAGEDHRFWKHCGVDWRALCRAFLKTIFLGRRQGGSTIAMQLVRTITGRYEPTPLRKLIEITLAIRLTCYLGRSRLPALYLWVAYYGWRMNNFRQACAQLSLNPASMSALDAAMFVARLKYPQPQVRDTVRRTKIYRRGLHLIKLCRGGQSKSTLHELCREWNHLKSQPRLGS